jgi:hypothetical protein
MAVALLLGRVFPPGRMELIPLLNRHLVYNPSRSRPLSKK